MKTIQKINLMALWVFASLVISCSRNEPRETETEKFHRQEAALQSSRDSAESVFAQTLDEINTSLNSLDDKKEYFAYNAVDREGKMLSKKEQIDNKISAIRTVLETNREKIAQLRSEASSFAGARKKWKKELQRVEGLMKEREDEIASLKQQLANDESVIAARNNEISEQSSKIAELTSSVQFAEGTSNKLERELYKGYYTTGTAKELKKNHVVQKEGGILGIGSTETLKPDFEKAAFTEIDTRQATGIVINGKKAKLITHHPIDSYELKKEDNETEYLTIKNPDRFWSSSKYLVVETR